MTLAEANAEHDSHRNPTQPESFPKLRAAFRIPGPLRMHDIQGRSASHPFIDGDNRDPPNEPR